MGSTYWSHRTDFGSLTCPQTPLPDPGPFSRLFNAATTSLRVSKMSSDSVQAAAQIKHQGAGYVQHLILANSDWALDASADPPLSQASSLVPSESSLPYLRSFPIQMATEWRPSEPENGSTALATPPFFRTRIHSLSHVFNNRLLSKARRRRSGRNG